MAEEKQEHPIHELVNMMSGQGGSKASWPVTLFLIAALVIAISILGIRLAMAKRKAAELASKARRAEEAQIQANEKKGMAKNKEERLAAKAEFKAASAKAKKIKQEVAKTRARHNTLVKDMTAVTSWDDVQVVDRRS